MMARDLPWAVCALLALSAASQGAVIEFEASTEFSGAYAPAGPAPWVVATFDDQDTPGSVLMTLSDLNLIDGEFVHEWYVNIDPAIDPGALSFTQVAKTGASRTRP